MYVIDAPGVLREKPVISVVAVKTTVVQRFYIGHVAKFSTNRIYKHKAIIFNEIGWACGAYG